MSLLYPSQIIIPNTKTRQDIINHNSTQLGLIKNRKKHQNKEQITPVNLPLQKLHPQSRILTMKHRLHHVWQQRHEIRHISGLCLDLMRGQSVLGHVLRRTALWAKQRQASRVYALLAHKHLEGKCIVHDDIFLFAGAALLDTAVSAVTFMCFVDMFALENQKELEVVSTTQRDQPVDILEESQGIHTCPASKHSSEQ